MYIVGFYGLIKLLESDSNRGKRGGAQKGQSEQGGIV